MKNIRRFCCGILSLAVGLSLSAAPRAEAAVRRAWDVKDAFRMKSLRDLEASPRGDALLYVVSERTLEPEGSSSSLWIHPLNGGNPGPLAGLPADISSPRWSPDGSRIAFFGSDDSGMGLWVVRRDGSALQKLAPAEKSNAYVGMRDNELCWLPDGTALVYNAAGPRHYDHDFSPLDPPTRNDVMVIDRLLYKAFYYYSDLRRTHVFRVPAAGGTPTALSSGDFDYHSISVSPDGKRVACISNRTGRDDENSNNDICILSAEGGNLVQLTRTAGPEYAPFWSPDGSKIAYLGRERDHRSKESDAENYKVCVIPASGGEPVNLTAPLDQWSTSPRWSADGKRVYFTADNAGRVCLYEAPAGGGKVRPIIEDDGQVGAYAVGPDGRVYFVYRDFAHPDEIDSVDGSGANRRKLTAFNDALAAEVDILKPESFVCRSFDGLKVQGWILKPLNFVEGRKYPMVLNIHGGPHGQFGYVIAPFVQYLAANGYAVMFSNPRGSTGYGQEFSDGCIGDLGGGDYRDVMACVDHVIGRFPWIDAERLGVTGGSYGGYLTNWIITHTDRFKAAVPVAGISNLISDWADANPDWFESDGGFMPMEDYDRAWAMSPLKYVAACKTPTLFIHGAWDFCVNLGQAEEMYTALKKLGVDAVLAIYPNEGHGVRQPRHQVDYHTRALAWFDKYLK